VLPWEQRIARLDFPFLAVMQKAACFTARSNLPLIYMEQDGDLLLRVIISVAC
jgi:hypothetical protein